MTKEIEHSIFCADLFPIPLVIDNYGESARELNRRLLDDIDSEMSEKSSTSSRSFVSAWQSETGLESKFDSFVELQTLINASAATYLTQIKYDDPGSAKCMGLWANHVSGKAGHSMYHIHGSGDVIATGVYYPSSLIQDGRMSQVNLDEFTPLDIFKPTGLGGELIIYDPNYVVKRQLIKPPGSQYYEALKEISPRESLLLIFPNYLPHSVEPLSEEKIQRYSISFTIEKNKN